MSIENDLQQEKPFKDEYQRAVVNLMFTSRYVEGKLKSIYKIHDITMKQYNILRILKGAGQPISTQLIRERMIDRMSDISRIVDRMLDKGLVTKCVNGQDKRLVDIELSSKGAELLSNMNIQEEKNSFHQDLLKHLSKEEANQLSLLLDKIRGYK